MINGLEKPVRFLGIDFKTRLTFFKPDRFVCGMTLIMPFKEKSKF